MTVLIGVAAAVAAVAVAFQWRRTLSVPCRIDLEATHEHFHAHVELAGVLPNPGDTVSVSGAPSRIPFGERRELASRARVERASFLKRWWTRLAGAIRFHELYDVGFE